MKRNLIPSDRTVQAMRPGIKRLNDGAGLHLRQSNSGKHWYQDYSFKRKRNSLSLGAYPEIGLAEARRLSHEMRSDAAHGIDPAEKRRAQVKADRDRAAARRLLGRQDAEVGSFEHLARAWFEVRTYAWSEEYAKSVIGRMEKHVFPVIGQRPIESIQRSETQVCSRVSMTPTPSSRQSASMPRVAAYATSPWPRALWKRTCALK